jgi:signal transducing adaptor molecule
LKLSLKKWAEGDFKSDPQLNLIPSLYKKMKQEGHDFSEPQAVVKREVEKSSDPNVVSSQQEEDDIAKAIELSLKDTSTPKKGTVSAAASSSLYPSMNSLSLNNNNNSSASASVAAPAQEPRKVRALYDFEAAEDNELTFKAGEVIMVNICCSRCYRFHQ